MSVIPGKKPPTGVSSMDGLIRSRMRLKRTQPLRQVVVHEHRRDQWPECIEGVVSTRELGVDEVDLPPVRLERDAGGLEMLPEAAEVSVDGLLLARLGAHLGEIHEVELDD